MKTEDEGIGLSSLTTTLRGPYPNPFNRQSTTEYVLSESQHVTIELYDVLGRRIRTLVNAWKETGLHTIRWNGQNRYGQEVGSGVYFCRMRAEGTTKTRKIVRVR